MNTQCEVVFSYTRAEAIADGVLIDVSEPAKTAGFQFPVALTAAVWSECVAWDDSNGDSTDDSGQDPKGRLWDVIWMARIAAKKAKGSTVNFQVLRVPQSGVDAEPVELKMVVGPGDGFEPVITIMLPNED